VNPTPTMSSSVSLPASARRLQPSAVTNRNWVLAFVGLASTAAAAFVAYEAVVNEQATPGGAAGSLARAAYVLAPAVVGIYAWHRHPEERLGRLLIVFAAVAAIWTLNGSSDPALFSVALFGIIVAAPMYSYLVLSFPEGRLHTRLERWVVAGSGAVIVLCWAPLVFIASQPAIATPLLRCAPRCPRDVFFTGALPSLERASRFGVRFGFAVMLVGVVVLLVLRWRSSTVPMRRMLAPVLGASILYACALALYLALQPRGGSTTAVSGWIVIVTIPLVPLALLVGLGREQVFVRSALARLVGALPGFEDNEHVEAALASAFQDESLQIVYWRPADGRYVDAAGAPVWLPSPGASMAVTKLERDGGPLAAILHDAALADDSRFIGAIAAAAMVGVEKAQLEADLQVSRRRLVRAGDVSRERIERNLHDGAQQQLVALRVRLQLAAEAIEAGSSDAAALVREIGIDMGAAVEELRRFAQGIYPPLLARHGLEEALNAAALRATLPTTVEARQVGRYDPDVEASVYFCCVEALQNATKHAGPDASVAIRLSCDDRALRFEVVDTGVGFDERSEANGSGLTNMRDRIGAVGGKATISSTMGHGTSISGAIPIA
jgi:signal transduction histidine kinase